MEASQLFLSCGNTTAEKLLCAALYIIPEMHICSLLASIEYYEEHDALCVSKCINYINLITRHWLNLWNEMNISATVYHSGPSYLK